MRGLIWDGTNLAEHTDLEITAPGPGQITVDISVAGLCHSDLKPIDGDMAQPVPAVLGHEAVGVVTDRGENTTIEIGQRVVLSVLQSCGECSACRRGRPTLCAGPGMTNGRPAEGPSPFRRSGHVVERFRRIGAFAERTVVEERQAIPIGSDIPDAEAALLGCAVITAFGAVEQRAEITDGESVLVIGAGGIGLNAVQAAHLAGASRVVVADTNPRKELIARAMGASAFLHVGSNHDVSEEARRMQPTGFDAVFECVGSAPLIDAAVRATAWGGRTVMIGVPAYGVRFDLDAHALFHDQSLIGCRMGGLDPHSAIPDLVRRYERGELKLESLISRVVPMSDAGELISEFRAGKLDRGLFDVRREV